MQPDKSDQMQPAQRELRSVGSNGVTRRRVVQGFGGVALGAALAGNSGIGPAAAATAPPVGEGVKVLIGGTPAKVGSYAFPSQVPELVLDNGLVRAAFGRDDVGVPTGWQDVSITATSIVVAGTELAHNLNGVNPRDPDRQHSFYVDASGGKTRLVCSRVDVLRAEPGLVEVAFLDTTSTPLQHEHHLVMRSGHRGIYGYDIMTAVTDTAINEVRMNTRWDRSILDHAYNWERGAGQQPTYAYLATQQSVQDETWRVDGVNNPNLPSPESNSGNLPAGAVYSKYDWSLYHHENPMFGHFGNGFGAWFTPLGGVTDETLCGFYGAGPQHQDLGIHQDALILNYFSRNHYGEPAYPIPAGYRRLYGPWLTFFTVGDPTAPESMIAEAARTARAEISEHRAGAPWVSDSLYPSPAQRTTLTGRVRLADGRPAADFHVILSTQDSDSVFPIAEPTYFVRTDAQGRFELPGIPPAWQPGSTAPGSYVLYVQPADGSVTDLYRQPGVVVRGAEHRSRRKGPGVGHPGPGGRRRRAAGAREAGRLHREDLFRRHNELEGHRPQRGPRHGPRRAHSEHHQSLRSARADHRPRSGQVRGSRRRDPGPGSEHRHPGHGCGRGAHRRYAHGRRRAHDDDGKLTESKGSAAQL
ncbi:hypothetical protein [Sinomonas humi]|uniref:Rhamnogalacturonan endolyase n=1 Tax=Sinomonas humi TaxID=1338436 RepID=A0A0B2ADY8_9MICC|nr:hypothetical protein [Sinomonas humi]KHL01435.1 hypothetical protein LK10_16390 [Sinomonas humi]